MVNVRVVSKRASGTPHLASEVVVYIGRPSVLGNPFGMRSEADRAGIIEQYRDWLRLQYKGNPVVHAELHALARRVRQGESLALQCWCAPLPCHGDVIVEAINGINQKLERANGPGKPGSDA